MSDNNSINLSIELRQFIEVLVKEVILKEKSFENHKKYLRRYCKAEGIEYKFLEKNLLFFFELVGEWKNSHTKGSSMMVRTFGNSFLSESFIEQLFTCINNNTIRKSANNVEQYALSSNRKTKENTSSKTKIATIEHNSIYKISNGSLYGVKPLKGRVELPSVVEGNTVIRIGDSAFKRMRIESVVIPDSVTRIGSYAFEGCQRMKVAIIPDSVKEIEEGTFIKCRSLTRVDLSNNLRSIEPKLFAECENLSELYLPNSIAIIRKEAFRNCAFQKMVIPDSVTLIEDMAFYCCHNLCSIIMSERVARIGDMAFGGCKSLKSIVIPNSVRIIGTHALVGCSGLKEIIINHVNFEVIKDTISPSVSIRFSD